MPSFDVISYSMIKKLLKRPVPGLDVHRTAIPIDHPDLSVTTEKIANEAVTTTKLATLDHITLSGLTSDPPLTAGRIWFRSDVRQLRYTPDGSTVYVIDPAPVVDKGWSDTTPHYFPDAGVGAWYNLTTIQLNQPATGHKRAFEDLSTGYHFVHGWLLKKNISMSSGLEVKARVGAYHGYSVTRANLNFVILDDYNLDKTSRNNAYPWVKFGWTMSALGYANGSYGRPVSGYIIFTDPPSYSFSPANPGVSYNLITQVYGRRMHILYGYGDAWAADWDIWASLQRGVENTNLRYKIASKPPEIEVLKDLSKELPVDLALIAKWDGETRLWIKRKDQGIVLPLGRNIEITSIPRRIKRRLTINLFDKILRSEREPELEYDVLEVRLRTDKMDIHKMSNEWRLVFLTYKDTVEIIFGDSKWDGDKYGYYITTM